MVGEQLQREVGLLQDGGHEVGGGVRLHGGVTVDRRVLWGQKESLRQGGHSRRVHVAGNYGENNFATSESSRERHLMTLL